MADFYNTVPRADESPMDYWIRLNKAIDVADECLRRRNKSVEDPAAEAVMMFISYCPDPSLAMSFQFKPAEKWSAAEVQERLDSHQRDLKRVSSRTQHTGSLSACNQCTVTACSISVSSSPQQPASMPAQSLPPVSHLNPNAVPFSPDTSLQHMVCMMDRVLSLCTASLTSPSQVHADKTSNFKTNLGSACRVCRSKEHTTYSHCRRHRLCRHCLSPGHFGCGGLTVQPKCTYDLEIEVYGFKVVVPTLVVPGQRDEFIIGSNVIKCILQKMKSHDK